MEADKPGKYFDNRTHYFEVLNTARQARREGADRVALFGSRLRGEHTPNESDTDILIVKEGTSAYGEYDWRNTYGLDVSDAGFLSS